MTAAEISAPAAAPAATRPRVRLTGIGWGFVVMMACELLMAVNFNNNPLFAMTFMLAGVMLTAYWQTRRNLSRLAFRHWRTQPVFAGQTLTYNLEILEQGGFRHFAVGAEAEIDGECAAVSPEAGERCILQIRSPALQRGMAPAASVNLVSDYPLGLFRAVAGAPPLPRVPVYPAALGDRPLPGARNDELSHAHAEADTLSSLRRYREGDRISRIAWKASARGMHLLSSEFDGADDADGILLDWDRVADAAVEAKLSQICRWVLAAERQGLAYHVRMPGASLGPDGGDRHLRRCLRALAVFGLQEERT